MKREKNIKNTLSSSSKQSAVARFEHLLHFPHSSRQQGQPPMPHGRRKFWFPTMEQNKASEPATGVRTMWPKASIARVDAEVLRMARLAKECPESQSRVDKHFHGFLATLEENLVPQLSPGLGLGTSATTGWRD